MQHKQLLIKTIGWVMVLVVFVLSLVPLPEAALAVPSSDKWLHLFTYGFLTYWFLHAYKNLVFILLGFLIMGLLIECLQMLTPYRYFEWMDMLMNAGGVGLAWLFYHQLKIRINYLYR